MKQIKKYGLVILVCIILISAFLPIQSVFAADVPTNGKIYNIYNKASGKCLNVNLGADANGSNVIQWTKDGSLEQRFKVESYSSGYRLRAACSSNGAGRVVDVYKVNGAINSGYNVDIWSVPDDVAQIWTFTDRGSGYYSIHLKSNTNLVLTSVSTANGSGAGNGSTSAGNVIVQTYSSGNANQLWSFRETAAKCSYYEVDSVASGSNTNSFVKKHTEKMCYTFYGTKDGTAASVLSSLQTSDIFVYYGHGGPGVLLGNNPKAVSGDSVYLASTNIANLASNSLNNLKFALITSCEGALTPIGGTSIVDAIYGRGAKCVVGWTVKINAKVSSDWDGWCFEKLYTDPNKERQLYRGFQNADYWTLDRWLTAEHTKMQGNRVERGDINQVLYKL
ncbi:MAG: RICIN domain-containing protein [Oscillospiraceae bacterium]|nr:RICIN domain-containing protein [Oscillospiraceae bacterium]